ncbi:MAG TPA: FAD-binding protein, partial [Rugosimonospora sp.]|nr:FAD-binding protein [Rugosimonospora sp.]
MKDSLSRRKFLQAAAAGAAVVGFDLRERSWVTQARAQVQSFQGVPKLDGVLLFDEASRKAIAVDLSNLFHRIPAAVLRTGSFRDIVKIVQYANQRSLKVVMKGRGHSQYGQTQAENGIVIDSGNL